MVFFRHHLWLAALVVLSGCSQFASQPKRDLPKAAAMATERPVNLQQHIRNNCASLLYHLLNDEKNLSKILIIKHESDDLHQLVKRISRTTGDWAGRLKNISTNDPSFNLEVMGLPSGEAATREAVAKTKEHELLHAKGADFEFKLLLTQTEALSYGSHLAQVAAENEPKPEQAQVFSGIQTDLEKLYAEVCDHLRPAGPGSAEVKPK